jgi:WD40 repeat protein
MQAARKIEAFSVDARERWAFAGDLCGRLYTIDLDRFEVISEVQAHAGTIMSVATSPAHPYVACLSLDQTVSVLRYNERGVVTPLGFAAIRELSPSNDDPDKRVPIAYSQLHPLGFHDSERRLVTRTANAGVLELAFDESGTFELLTCTRLHGLWDLVNARYVVGSDQVLSSSADGTIVLSEAGKPAPCSWGCAHQSRCPDRRRNPAPVRNPAAETAETSAAPHRLKRSGPSVVARAWG